MLYLFCGVDSFTVQQNSFTVGEPVYNIDGHRSGSEKPSPAPTRGAGVQPLPLLLICPILFNSSTIGEHLYTSTGPAPPQLEVQVCSPSPYF